jgi:transcriptional regulator of aromatic amino acid metabolism
MTPYRPSCCGCCRSTASWGGEDQEVPVDVRVIAATHRDLAEMVQQSKFRADLFHRLNVLSIHIPRCVKDPQTSSL